MDRKVIAVATVGVAAIGIILIADKRNDVDGQLVEQGNAAAVTESATSLQTGQRREFETRSSPSVAERDSSLGEAVKTSPTTLELEKPDTTSSYRCEQYEGVELLCGELDDPNWMQLLDDETLFQVGLTDPYAAYLAAGRLTTIDPDRAFEYSLRSVALSGKVTALLGNKQPKDGVELTDEVLAELDKHSAVTSMLHNEILERSGYPRSANAPALYWDEYLSKHPEDTAEMFQTLGEWKTFLNEERQKVLGETFFSEVSP